MNFCAVASALHECGYRALGVRIDSGDLAYLSIEVFNCVKRVGQATGNPDLEHLLIIASNDINEETIYEIKNQKNHINCFGIGTNLVTCQKQPALGCVYKLVQINDRPTIKLSADAAKVTMPGRKAVYRLYNAQGLALLDLMQKEEEPPPQVGKAVLCRHPTQATKRANALPHRVERLLRPVWQSGRRVGPTADPTPLSLQQLKHHVRSSLDTIRPDIKRRLNPTPYKVSVTEALFNEIQRLHMDSTPIGLLS